MSITEKKVLMKKVMQIILIVIVTNVYSQSNNDSALKVQAEKMAKAFMSNDFNVFIKYSNPQLVKMIGGSNKMIEVLNKSVVDMKSKEIIFESITFNEPTKVIKSGNELQSTIQQITKVKTPSGGVMRISTLVAISTNNGVNWTFIDISNNDIATIKQLLPNLSNSITIPKQIPDKFY
jgi:hypothetical protein